MIGLYIDMQSKQDIHFWKPPWGPPKFEIRAELQQAGPQLGAPRVARALVIPSKQTQLKQGEQMAKQTMKSMKMHYIPYNPICIPISFLNMSLIFPFACDRPGIKPRSGRWPTCLGSCEATGSTWQKILIYRNICITLEITINHLKSTTKNKQLKHT